MDEGATVKTPLGEEKQLISYTILWLRVHACLDVPTLDLFISVVFSSTKEQTFSTF